MNYGKFNDQTRQYIITTPDTPRPWINYLGNRRLQAFVSQNAGGLLWHHEPYSRRITRYHHLPALRRFAGAGFELYRCFRYSRLVDGVASLVRHDSDRRDKPSNDTEVTATARDLTTVPPQ